MTFESLLLFSIAVVLLIVSPGPSVAVVLGRTLGSGFRAGMTTALGVYLGGATYLVLSFAGLTSLALSAGPLFSLVKYLSAAYLIYFGWKAFKAAGAPTQAQAVTSGSNWCDLGVGLMVTLSNPKPIIFYSAILPTFFDMTLVTTSDLGILLITLAFCTLTVQGTYAYLSNKTRKMASSGKIAKRLGQTSGGAMITAGMLVALR